MAILLIPMIYLAAPSYILNYSTPTTRGTELPNGTYKPAQMINPILFLFMYVYIPTSILYFINPSTEAGRHHPLILIIIAISLFGLLIIHEGRTGIMLMPLFAIYATKSLYDLRLSKRYLIALLLVYVAINIISIKSCEIFMLRHALEMGRGWLYV